MKTPEIRTPVPSLKEKLEDLTEQLAELCARLNNIVGAAEQTKNPEQCKPNDDTLSIVHHLVNLGLEYARELDRQLERVVQKL